MNVNVVARENQQSSKCGLDHKKEMILYKNNFLLPGMMNDKPRLMKVLTIVHKKYFILFFKRREYFSLQKAQNTQI